MSLEQTVVKNLECGYLCSESVIKGAAENMGITWDRLPAIATGLGGGIGGMASVCGALTGAVLALGLINGRNTPDQDPFACTGLAQKLVESFNDRFKSIDCADILGVDIRTEEGRNYAMAQGLVNLPCKDCCVFVARYIAENMSESR
ncbi:MAG: C_GCAxxG_C_C family protein [Deltaproteobacteria bacterium]|nr:C_GCAxxG_C_C family protein [Deltaproteobacteria bacterium]